MKTTKAYSLDVEVVKAIEKVVQSGRYKNASVFVERCVVAHFEPEFPDLEGEAAIKRAEELELVARGYRDMAVPKPIEVKEEPIALSEHEEAIFKASATDDAKV